MAVNWESKSNLKRVYHAVDKRIIGVLSMNAPARKAPRVKKVDVVVDGARDYEHLIEAARRYDAQRFFVANKDRKHKQVRAINGGGLIMSAYIKTRDRSINTVKVVYRLRHGK